MEHLRQSWRLARTASGGGARLQHFFLPDDPDEAHRALVHLTRTARRVLAANLHPYDHGRIADIAANEGFSHHPIHGAAPSSGYMASYHAPEESGVAVVHHISQLGPEHIAEHRRTIDTHLRNPSSFQGGWHDTATGDVYLDASRHFDHKHEALDFAAEQKQKAVFHLGDFSEHFLHPHQDPLAMKDKAAWHERYGPNPQPHPGFHSYAHLYPFTDEQKAHFAAQGEHVASREKRETAMAGRPIGAFRASRADSRR